MTPFFAIVNKCQILTVDLQIQSNLSIVDMLYSGHVVIADTFSRIQPSHGQTFIKNLQFSRHFYSGKLL